MYKGMYVSWLGLWILLVNVSLELIFQFHCSSSIKLDGNLLRHHYVKRTFHFLSNPLLYQHSNAQTSQHAGPIHSYGNVKRSARQEILFWGKTHFLPSFAAAAAVLHVQNALRSPICLTGLSLPDENN